MSRHWRWPIFFASGTSRRRAADPALGRAVPGAAAAHLSARIAARDGGIGYAVAKWTKDPKVAADLVRLLAGGRGGHWSDDASWQREALGIWDETTMIAVGSWTSSVRAVRMSCRNTTSRSWQHGW